MVDRLTPQRRSWLMSRVTGKNTSPELRVRKVAHALGLRFRLHPTNLPGKPDLVFPKREIALFVHGCFWHQHPGCRKATAPSSDFWREKFEKNIARDVRVTKELKELGWKVRVIWECQTKKPEQLSKQIEKLVLKRPKKKAKKNQSLRRSP